MFLLAQPKKIQFITKKDQDVLIDKSLPNETIYISKSEKCTFDISTQRIMKFITEESSEIKVKISSSITTSTVEVFKSAKIDLDINTTVHTIHIEDSTEVKINLSEKIDWKELSLVTKGCKGLFVSYKSKDFEVVPPQDVEKNSQLVTAIVEDKLVTTPLLRKGLVGITVKEEDRKRLEENEKKKEEMFSQFRNLKNTSEVKLEKEKKHKNSSIIIVGSGMAGIAAAKKLLELNPNYKITILEASDRIGGRAQTKTFGSTPVDLGCCWIEGYDFNPVAEQVEKMKFHVFNGTGKTQLYLDDGQKISSGKGKDYFNLVLQTARNEYTQNKEDLSIQEAIDKVFKLSNIEMDSEQKQVYDWNLSSLEQYDAADLSELSLKNYGKETVFSGGDRYVKEGYGNWVATYGKDLNVTFNQKVKEIKMNENDFEVITEDKFYQADFVIVTVSVGVLKSGMIKFSPELPEKKTNIINKMKMGNFNKLILEFKEPFWPKDIAIFGYCSKVRGKFRFILNYDYYFPNSNILIFFLTASHAKEMEKDPKDTLNQAMEVLTKLFEKTSELVSHHLTNWSSNPYTLGSYSFMGVGMTVDDFVSLGDPVNRKLFFAGEATTTYYSHLHSAFISGERDALRIHKLTEIDE